MTQVFCAIRKLFREPRQHVSVAIDNPKHCLPLPDTILANNAYRLTTKQNNKLTKTIMHLEQSREYLECLEEYSLYCYKKLILIGTQPALIERSEEETDLSTLSLWVSFPVNGHIHALH